MFMKASYDGLDKVDSILSLKAITKELLKFPRNSTSSTFLSNSDMVIKLLSC